VPSALKLRGGKGLGGESLKREGSPRGDLPAQPNPERRVPSPNISRKRQGEEEKREGGSRERVVGRQYHKQGGIDVPDSSAPIFGGPSR